MQIVKNFQPDAQNTKNIAVSAAAQYLLVNFRSGRNTSVRIHNATTAVVFIDFYHTNVPSVAISATNGVPIPAGGVEVFSVGVGENGILYVANISPAGTGSIYATPGEGS